ncbi:MAG: 30S ribosomal protein S16 [Patescibacteria group bacterium]
MLKIKLQRTGRKHEPTFRLLLTDSKNSTKTGKFLEVLGSHDFRKENTELKKDRILYWMKQGVKPTPTVHNLLVTHKIVDAKKVNVQPRRTPKEKKTK